MEKCKCGCKKCCKPEYKTKFIEIDNKKYNYFESDEYAIFPFCSLEYSQHNNGFSGFGLQIWYYKFDYTDLCYHGNLIHVNINNIVTFEKNIANAFLSIHGKTLEECFKNGLTEIKKFFTDISESLIAYEKNEEYKELKNIQF